MKVFLYDPMYSNVGHYSRYNKYLLKLLGDLESIEKVFFAVQGSPDFDRAELSNKVEFLNLSAFLPQEVDTSQDALHRYKGASRIKLYFLQFLYYRKVMKLINRSDYDLAFFSNGGMVPFWLSILIGLKKKFLVSLISIKPIYDKGSRRDILLRFFSAVVRRSSLVFVTEEIYKEKMQVELDCRVAVLHDRYLTNKKSPKLASTSSGADNNLKLLTLGTMATSKNPINFIKKLCDLPESINSRIEYQIYGKSHDSVGDEVTDLTKNIYNINYHNEYIDDEKYNELMEWADFIVIPYSTDYTNYMTSGVMWDCFEYRIPVLLPSTKLFDYYIDNYNFGYSYTDDNFTDTIKDILSDKATALGEIENNYLEFTIQKSYGNCFKQFKLSFEHVISSFK